MKTAIAEVLTDGRGTGSVGAAAGADHTLKQAMMQELLTGKTRLV